MGLDDALYGTVRLNLLATEPLPSLNRVYSTLIQEERVKTMARVKGEQGEIIALAAQAGSEGKKRGDSRDKNTVCTHCKKVGHEAVDCFQLVGYPD